MKISEAIKTGSRYLEGSDEADPVEFNKFVRLGIEALKCIRYQRNFNVINPRIQLPGETKD